MLQAAAAAATAGGTSSASEDGVEVDGEPEPWFMAIVQQLLNYARVRSNPANAKTPSSVLVQQVAKDVAIPLAAHCATQ